MSKVAFEKDSNLRFIGDSCFEGCQIESLIIPSTVEFVGVSAFRGIDRLVVDKQNPHFYLGNELLFSIDRLNIYALCRTIHQIFIPKEVRTLKSGCFTNNGTLQQVIFDEQSVLETIEDFAFVGTGIQTITIPKGRFPFVEKVRQ